ncbi:MAG TPA: GntR family transcriptional regulator [Solirubrobacteraceae bacterium]|nr:GntR family transcriptional regulator [Solirubrobacteraceae bacterium]
MAEVQFQPLEAPERLADMVYETIRQSIMDKTLAPGARLTESGLAAQLGVSKTPVREALLRLRRIGVIEPDGVRGGRVIRPSRSAIREAYEIREALEVFAVRSVAERVSGADLERICDTAARSLEHAERGDQAGFREWDFAFHRAIAEASVNPRLKEMIEDVFTLIGTLRQRDFPDSRWSVDCARGHVRMADAIARRDVEAAQDAAREHIRQVESYVLAEPSLAG